jgi:hypothetical protein
MVTSPLRKRKVVNEPGYLKRFGHPSSGAVSICSFMRRVLTAFFLLMVVTSCDQKQTARKKLERMKLEPTAEGFVKAASEGDAQAVRLFLQMGADPNVAAGSPKELPLEAAASGGHVEVVRLLANRPGIDQGMALTLALSGRSNAEIVSTLLRSKADAGERCRPYRQSCLQYAVSINAPTPCVKALLAKPFGLNSEYEEGNTPLLIAAHKRNTELVGLLLQAGAKIGHENKDGLNATDLAAKNSDETTLKLLKEHGGVVKYNPTFDRMKSLEKGWLKLVERIRQSVEMTGFVHRQMDVSEFSDVVAALRQENIRPTQLLSVSLDVRRCL